MTGQLATRPGAPTRPTTPHRVVRPDPAPVRAPGRHRLSEPGPTAPGRHRREEPDRTDPVREDPVGTEPIRTDPVGTAPERTEPRRTEPIRTQSIRTAPVRTQPVRPAPVEPGRMEGVFERTAGRTPDATALECDGEVLSYAALEARANRLAHLLAGQGIGPGSRVAILLPRSTWTYVALLAVLKAGAAFVPIDPDSPPDRVAYVGEDAAVDLVLSVRAFDGVLGPLARGRLALDTPQVAALLAAAPQHRPRRAPDADPDPAAYVIYTSGSSGRPKGVEVTHASIANFLSVVPRVYDVRPTDRVHQGMTISFDFSIEEIWPTWAVGATLVAGPDDERRLGAELGEHLDAAGITVLYSVPTLLATVPQDLPRLRSVLVGGEACPAEIVERWARPGRRMLNTYGPTEATVTATWGELRPGEPVTIGRPLPTYTAELFDVDGHHPLDAVPGETVGEIVLGGPGVARGYVGRPELTAEKFLTHPRTGRRVYRTGDLGRFTRAGDIEYLGRADAEVKVRGHRVDLGEIESVLLTDPEVGAAVVTLDKASGELAAYVVDPDARPVADVDARATRLHGLLGERLPGYMIPATLDVLDALPTQASGKVDRTRLPPPSGRRLIGAAGPVVAARDDLEERVAAVFARVLGIGVDQLSVTADFFDALGGHSLLAATVVTGLREAGIEGDPAVRDLYTHPTVAGLTARLRERSELPAEPAAPREEPLRHSSRRVAIAGGAQAAGLYVLLLLLTVPVSWVYTTNDGEASVAVLAELLAAGTATYLGVRWVLPALLVRPLGAGIRAGRYPLWGVTYLRLWAMDLLLTVSPLPVLAGSPFAAPYLRALGARVGRRTHLAAATVGLPSMIRVDDDAAVGYGAHLHPWRVEDGWVVVAPIRVGVDAVVGANAVVEPGATVADGAVLGDQSVLTRDERMAPGAWRSGSPSRPVDPESVRAAMLAGDRLPGWRPRHLPGAVAGLVGLEAAAVAMIVPSVLLVWGALLLWGVLAGLVATLLSGPLFVATVCVVVALGRRAVLPRTPTGIFASRSGLGLRKWVADGLLTYSLAFTNSLYATLYTATWMRVLGARVGRGAEVSTTAHIDPDLLTLGTQSFVADMASVGSASFAGGRMLLRTTEIGDRAFVGNAAHVPAGTRTGPGSLVGVHTVPPVVVGADTSWLGSPALHLPRRQHSGDYAESETFRPSRARVRQRLGIEFVRATLPASLLGLSVYGYLLLLSLIADGRGLLPVVLLSPLAAAAMSLLVVAYVAAVKRNVVGRYRPRVEPLWNPFVRRSEFVTGLFEAAAVPAAVGLLVGTPFLPVVLRLFGARIGRRVWMGTTYLTEFDLVEIGDDAVVGRGVSLQTHLFEDRVMKMSTVRVAAGACVGDRSIVLYDAVVGPGVGLDALSLLMKGEELSGAGRWHGIPAEAVAA